VKIMFWTEFFIVGTAHQRCILVAHKLYWRFHQLNPCVVCTPPMIAVARHRFNTGSTNNTTISSSEHGDRWRARFLSIQESPTQMKHRRVTYQQRHLSPGPSTISILWLIFQVGGSARRVFLHTAKSQVLK
jgi:hypothetical protein